uniref:Phosphorylase kinase regulatory subunit alpha 2 n=1 Tax=Molossus molossus TaxID=27622 RepID=A0A7J8J8J6_MOLMO|nr:phosphorylase kinase regulatory subunit alpha 2 [Molossus molossus]
MRGWFSKPSCVTSEDSSYAAYRQSTATIYKTSCQKKKWHSMVRDLACKLGLMVTLKPLTIFPSLPISQPCFLILEIFILYLLYTRHSVRCWAHTKE